MADGGGAHDHQEHGDHAVTQALARPRSARRRSGPGGRTRLRRCARIGGSADPPSLPSAGARSVASRAVLRMPADGLAATPAGRSSATAAWNCEHWPESSWPGRPRPGPTAAASDGRRVRHGASACGTASALHPVQGRVGHRDQLGRRATVGGERGGADRDAPPGPSAADRAAKADSAKAAVSRSAVRPASSGRPRAGGSRIRRRRSAPAMSEARRVWRIRSAVQRRTSSPRRWPNVSLTSLKSSRSSISRLSGRMAPARADGFLAEPLVEVAVVEEAGQGIAVGEGSRLLVEARVLERDRRPRWRSSGRGRDGLRRGRSGRARTARRARPTRPTRRAGA